MKLRTNSQENKKPKQKNPKETVGVITKTKQKQFIFYPKLVFCTAIQST